MSNISSILLYSGSGLIFVWGLAHLFPTKSVVNGFGQISTDNRCIITMEWIAAGMTMCFIGALCSLIAIVSDTRNMVSLLVFRSSSVMLVILALLTVFTGARTRILPIKLCPVVNVTAAALIFLGTILYK